jgi:hypothetical protein
MISRRLAMGGPQDDDPMLKTSLPSVLCAAVLLSGCATVASGPAAERADARTYPDSRAAIWQRILSASAGNSLFIRQADVASGVITVDRDVTPAGGAIFGESAIFSWAECGRASVLDRTVSQKIEINYLVREQSNGPTTVTINSRFRELRTNITSHQQYWVTCTSTGGLERKLLDSLYYAHPV